MGPVGLNEGDQQGDRSNLGGLPIWEHDAFIVNDRRRAVGRRRAWNRMTCQFPTARYLFVQSLDLMDDQTPLRTTPLCLKSKYRKARSMIYPLKVRDSYSRTWSTWARLWHTGAEGGPRRFPPSLSHSPDCASSSPACPGSPLGRSAPQPKSVRGSIPRANPCSQLRT